MVRLSWHGGMRSRAARTKDGSSVTRLGSIFPLLWLVLSRLRRPGRNVSVVARGACDISDSSSVLGPIETSASDPKLPMQIRELAAHLHSLHDTHYPSSH